MKISERSLLIYTSLAIILLSVSVLSIPIKESRIKIDTEGYFTLGNPHAPVHIILFEEFACPHCKHFHEEGLPAVYEKYVQTGKAKITTIPTAYLTPSVVPFITATCASDQDSTHSKTFLDYLFSLRQDELFSSTAHDLLANYAKNHDDFHLGKAFECIQSEKIEARIERSRSLIGGDTIETPMMIINGRRVKKLTREEISKTIEEELHAQI